MDEPAGIVGIRKPGHGAAVTRPGNGGSVKVNGDAVDAAAHLLDDRRLDGGGIERK